MKVQEGEDKKATCVCFSNTDSQKKKKGGKKKKKTLGTSVFAVPAHTWQAGARQSVMLMSHLAQQDILLGGDQSTTDCLSFAANKSACRSLNWHSYQ